MCIYLLGRQTIYIYCVNVFFSKLFRKIFKTQLKYFFITLISTFNFISSLINDLIVKVLFKSLHLLISTLCRRFIETELKKFEKMISNMSCRKTCLYLKRDSKKLSFKKSSSPRQKKTIMF